MTTQQNKKIVILGMGPCGLGAAWQLEQTGYQDYRIFEAADHAGGLATSHVDEKGFTWDVGGHIQFSHYKLFDDLMDHLLPNEWIYHDRSSWIWIKDRFVPYPFQNNIRYLPPQDQWECLCGLIELQKQEAAKPRNFQEWIYAVFGKGISEIFMIPYNAKVWAYPLDSLSFSWFSDRVSVLDWKRALKNVLLGLDDVAWGPNNRFRYPLKGGTGEIWRRLSLQLPPEKVLLNHRAIAIDVEKRKVRFSNGHEEQYDTLITTIPLPQMMKICGVNSSSDVFPFSSTHILGIGLKGSAPAHLKTKCWMYFPEEHLPFYRVTVFSNYSPNNVPDPNNYWSLMAEVSESPFKPVSKNLAQQVVSGLLESRLIESRNQITNVWHHFERFGYPTPFLGRDEALKILDQLEQQSIFSRGRFGAWKYEVSNQDHTFMQGVEVVKRILFGETEITLQDPGFVNSGRLK